MKALKISLAVITIAAIAFFVIRSLVKLGDIGGISLPRNQFIERIVQEIDSLDKLPDNKFCKNFYNEVEYLINDFYKPTPPTYPYGRLGKTQTENDQWKQNLLKNLYSSYTDKFIKQAFCVFNGSDWVTDDLNFIRSEYQTLRRSPLLEKGSPVDKKFTEIQTIFSKYDEIVGFISHCKGFTFSSSKFDDNFPISDVAEKISKAKDYQNNHLHNAEVNNCIRLHDGLREIPQVLFRAHINYLDSKISYWSDMYPKCKSHTDYVNTLNRPLKNEIEALNNSIYNISSYDREYKRLLEKWSEDNKKAFNFKYPTE